MNTDTLRKILFIDRDGTLIREPADFQVDSVEKVALADGVIPALLVLKNAGYEFVIVSNQDGLGTATFPQGDFEKAHGHMLQLFHSQGIGFTETLICPHLESDRCGCRKPGIALVLGFLKDRTVNWPACAMIGDRASDEEFANALGIPCYRLDTGGGRWSWKDIARSLSTKPRTAVVRRKTNETAVTVTCNLDGQGAAAVNTGIGFFDHMIEQVARHSGIDITLSIEGDLHIDDHHTVEDAGITLGEAMRRALGSRNNIGRYGFTLPMDECRAEVLIDLSGRPLAKVDIPFSAGRIGSMATEMVGHFFYSWAVSAGAGLHITVTPGNQHHMAESAFKAFGRALGQAVALTGRVGVPSSKGIL